MGWTSQRSEYPALEEKDPIYTLAVEVHYKAPGGASH